MKMTIKEAIEITNHYLDYPKKEVIKALLLAIETMRKYQKIEKIIDAPDGCSSAKYHAIVNIVKHYSEVVENGNDK